jgi:hypothetical protein
VKKKTLPKAASPKAKMAPAVLAFLKRYSFESLLSLGLIALVTPVLDQTKAAVLGQNEGPSFYIDRIACPAAASPAPVGGDCHVLNLRIPGGLQDRTLSQVDIVPFAGGPEVDVRFSEPIEADVDKEFMRVYGYASIRMNGKVGKGKLLLVTAHGHFSPDTSVGVTLDGRAQEARKLAVADGRILFLTEYWRQILLVSIAGLFTVRYRQLVLERLSK